MPWSLVRTFTDPEDYAASIRTRRVELTLTEPGSFTGKIIQIDLHRLWMQRIFDNLPRILHAVLVPDGAAIIFRIQPGPMLLEAGVEMHPNTITRYSRGQDFQQRSFGSAGGDDVTADRGNRFCRSSACRV